MIQWPRACSDAPGFGIGHDLIHQGQLLRLALGLRQRRQGDLVELGQVACQPLRGLTPGPLA